MYFRNTIMLSSSIAEAFLFSLNFIVNCLLYWTHPNFQWYTFFFFFEMGFPSFVCSFNTVSYFDLQQPPNISL